MGVGRRDGAEPGPTHCISVPRHVPRQPGKSPALLQDTTDSMSIAAYAGQYNEATRQNPKCFRIASSGTPIVQKKLPADGT